MNNLLTVKNLKKYFPITKGIIRQKIIAYVKAVDDISFTVGEKQIVALVGESGCGKTTVGRTILRLIELTSGEVFYKNQNIHKLNNKEMRELRKEMQIIFQDPYASLNPRMNILNIVGEPFDIFKIYKGKEKEEKVKELLIKVGLKEDDLKKYPHEFSGGQRQRIGIARSIALNPNFIVADEPVSALDVSIQAQIVNLLQKLHSEENISFLFISHDLSLVRQFCHQVLVMYLGKIVESGEVEDVFNNPLHPYTKALLSAVPVLDIKKRRKILLLSEEVKDAINIPVGCRFHPRCPEVMEICKTQEPEFKNVNDKRKIACHLIK